MRGSRTMAARVAALAVAAVLVAACGGGSGNASKSGSTNSTQASPFSSASANSPLDGVDPCTLVTQQDAAAILHTDVIRGTDDTDQECTWLANTPQRLNHPTEVAIQYDQRLIGHDDLDSICNQQGQDCRIEPPINGHEVTSNIHNSDGDVSYAVDATHPIEVIVSTVDSSNDDHQLALTLLRTVIGRLPAG